MNTDFSVPEITDTNLVGADLRKTLADPLPAPRVFTRCDLRGADLGEPALDQAGHLRGTTITPAQAGALLSGLGITVSG